MSDAADNDAASTTSSAVAGSEAEDAGTAAMDSEATMTLWAQAPASDVDVGDDEFPMTFRTHEDGRQLVFTGEDDPSPPSYIIKEDDEA